MSGETNPPDKLQALRERVASASTPAERVEATMALAEEAWLKEPVTVKPLLEQVMAEADAAGRPKAHGRAAYMLGELLRRAGDLDGAARYAETVFTVADATGDLRARASGLNLRGIIHLERGELDSALDCFKELLEISRQAAFGEGERIALNELAGVHGLRAEFAEALAYYELSLEADTKAGDANGRAVSMYNIGWTLAAMGRWAEATQSFHRSIALCEEHGFADPLASARMALGEVSLKRSDYENAMLMFRAVVAGEKGKQHSGLVYREALSNLGWAHFRNGDLAQAEEIQTDAARLCEAAGDRCMLATVYCRRAELAIARGQLGAAADLLTQAEHHATDLKLTKEQGEVLRVHALLSVARGDSALAMELFGRSEAVLEPLGDTYELALARLHHGRQLLEAHCWEEALSIVQDAARTFRRLAVVAEGEEASRLLYRIEMRTDRNAALLQALLSITALNLGPAQYLERALAVLCDNMRFDNGAVLIGGRPVATVGYPDVSIPHEVTAQSQTEREVLLPIKDADSVVGLIMLKRALPLEVRVSSEVLEVVSETLAPFLVKLGELKAVETDIAREIPGLRFRGVVGRNRDVLYVLDLVARIAATPVPVLIRGESGVGKELVARALHESGPRADHPFVTVNCAAVPESLLEAEFFGVEAGAATGVAARAGKFELAGKGTIFLDEIGDMSPALQARLLRAVEDKRVVRVGGVRETILEARVIAATNMDLDLREREGHFRRDLLFRLNTVQLELPPLRRRPEDIHALTQYFIAGASQEYNRPVRGASGDVLTLFAAFAWPGNIRQLQHVVERAVILAAGDVLQVGDLPSELRLPGVEPSGRVPDSLRTRVRRKTDEFERALLIEALKQATGNSSVAMRLTGLGERQFYRLLRKHHLSSQTD
jgi:transcriptional regulator with PAS, ATPase and Fis domain/tetratricopeptide (TPR) repeat protein